MLKSTKIALTRFDDYSDKLCDYKMNVAVFSDSQCIVDVL